MILDRIKQFIDYKGIAVSAFEKSIGMSNASFGKSLRSGGAIGTDKLENILNVYPELSPSWLVSGEGPMLRDDDQPAKVSYDPSVGKPYFDVDFIGGFSEIFNDQTTLPACNVLVPGFEKASVWCNVTGHSMEPKINHGDIIALRECSINDIQYGEIYAVVLDTIRTIKILRRGSSSDVLRYVPINQDFDEQEFPISRIIRVFEVLGSIARFF
jgi:hypothetical protein